MTLNQKISRALLILSPTAEWVLRGDDYSKIEWLSENIEKPTWAEVENEIKNPTIIEMSVDNKLATVGLSLPDLKNALGL